MNADRQFVESILRARNLMAYGSTGRETMDALVVAGVDPAMAYFVTIAVKNEYKRGEI
jgi:hypothetical protein